MLTNAPTRQDEEGTRRGSGATLTATRSQLIGPTRLSLSRSSRERRRFQRSGKTKNMCKQSQSRRENSDSSNSSCSRATSRLKAVAAIYEALSPQTTSAAAAVNPLMSHH